MVTDNIITIVTFLNLDNFPIASRWRFSVVNYFLFTELTVFKILGVISNYSVEYIMKWKYNFINIITCDTELIIIESLEMKMFIV